MSKRDAFYDACLSNDGVDWPTDPAERTELAAKLVGARLMGATESVLNDALELSSGGVPEPGASDFQEKKRKADLLAKLSDEQRGVVQELLNDTARRVLYWSLVRLENLPGAALEVRVIPVLEDETEMDPCEVTEFLALHERFHDWVHEFADTLD